MVYIAGIPARYILIIPLVLVVGTMLIAPDAGYIHQLRHAFRHLINKIGICHDELHHAHHELHHAHDELANANDEIKNTGEDLKKTKRDLSKKKKELGTANGKAQMAALNNAILADDKDALEHDYHALNAQHIALKSKSAKDALKSAKDALDSKKELERQAALLAEKDEMIKNFTTVIAQLQTNVKDLQNDVQPTPTCWKMSGWADPTQGVYDYDYSASAYVLQNLDLNGGWLLYPPNFPQSTRYWWKQNCRGTDVCCLSLFSMNHVPTANSVNTLFLARCTINYGKPVSNVYDDCFKPRAAGVVTNWERISSSGSWEDVPNSADVEFKEDANTNCYQ